MTAPAPVTIDGMLDAARAAGVDRLDAQLVLAHELQRPRAWLIAHGDAEIEPAVARRLERSIERRAAGEPLAYLTGAKEFYGIRLAVDSRVLVPRPETELLVDWALSVTPPPAGGDTLRAVDLGTGSGAIALALKRHRPDAWVSAVDCSDAALAVARYNGQQLGLGVEWLAGHWWTPFGSTQVDLAVSNPPYVAEADPHLAALGAEPIGALASGPDGLDALRIIVAEAPSHLRDGAWLLVEHGWDQGEPVRALFERAGFTAIETRRDLGGQERCTGGRKPARTP